MHLSSFFLILLALFSCVWCEETHAVQVCPPYDPGDTAWVLLATILVLGMMPALGFFEAGLLRRKNALSIITEVIVGLAVMEFLWYVHSNLVSPKIKPTSNQIFMHKTHI
jgi:hypothetical protein